MFSHIIIVVQENRTIDNLFGAHASSPNCGTLGDFPGADIVSTGIGNGTSSSTCNASTHMLSGFDPNHQFVDWSNDYDNTKMDGFCDAGEFTPPCAPYSFVQASDISEYFNIATTYSFANYTGGAWQETILYNFTNCIQGCYPTGTLALDKAGNLYGASEGGVGEGNCGPLTCGVIYKLSPLGNGRWKFALVHKFVGTHGGLPLGVILDSKSNLYGVTSTFGAYGAGTAFELTP